MAKKSKPAAKKGKGVTSKPSAKKRSLNVGRGGGTGDPFNAQDKKRRLGNFESAGEHARVGGRTTGIVGQSKRKFRSDNKS